MLGWLSKLRQSDTQPGEPLRDAADRVIAKAIAEENAGNVARACEVYREAAALAPDYPKAHLNLGAGLEAAGDAAGARACYERVLALEPENAAGNYNLGKLLFTKGDYAEADRRLLKALETRPDFPDAHIMRGYVLNALGTPEAAAAEFQAGLAKKPDDAAARDMLARLRAALAVNEGLEHQRGGEGAQAESAYRKALEHDPRSADALHLLGRLASEAGREDEALAHYRSALAAAPDHVGATFDLAAIHIARSEEPQAVAAYQRLLVTRPDHPATLCNLGNVLKSTGRAAEALECYRKAVTADPQLALAHYNLGVAYRDDRRMDQAIASLRRAIELQPTMADAHFALGHSLNDADRTEEALASFRQALQLDPDHVQARWSITMAQLPRVPADAEEAKNRRQRFADNLAELERWFDERRAAKGADAVGTDQPFELAYVEEDNRPLLERYGALCVRLMQAWQRQQGLVPAAARGQGPIRVGFVSAHFRRHSVWNALTRGWFKELDRSRFALYAFDLGSDEDAETTFAKARARHYEHGPKDLRQWARAIAAHSPDVLIYPEVGMDPMTVRLASLRLAPVQAASWGHPETTGLPTIDYYLSAQDLEPEGAQAYYTERLVALPHLGTYFERIDPVASARPQKRDDVPLLISPGTPVKYAPRFDWVFAEIARRLGRCRIVFFSHWNDALMSRLSKRLQAAFRARGVDFSQCVTLMPWQNTADFLALLRRADAYLDTIGFSGFNTALHAVEAGLPVVTREGRFMRGRLASGILKRLGLRDTVAPTEDAYVELAVKLVQDPDYRASIARRMESARAGLYENRAPVRALEEFLEKAVQGR